MFPLKDTSNSHGFPFWVVLIIAANLYIFFLELTASNFESIITNYALIPAMVDIFYPPSLVPFVTSQFLHGGLLHILSNMWFLWVFGKNMEGKLGFLFPVFYILSGVLGNLAQFLLAPGSSIPIIGASGAIAGVLGAYYALFPDHKIKTFIFVVFFASVVEIPVSLMMFYWFITQLFSSAAAVAPSASAGNLEGGIAYFAHVGGFAAGWIIGRVLKR